MSGANPQHGTGPAREPVAWCWCYCCRRRLEVFRPETESFVCCGRTWALGDAQPRALHEGLGAEVETLRILAYEAASFLARWQGRRPKGLKRVLERIAAARAREKS